MGSETPCLEIIIRTNLIYSDGHRTESYDVQYVTNTSSDVQMEGKNNHGVEIWKKELCTLWDFFLPPLKVPKDGKR